MSEPPSDQDFKDNTVIVVGKNGCEIRCRLGLWSVFAPNLETATREAWHYFIQYFEDGEYSADA